MFAASDPAALAGAIMWTAFFLMVTVLGYSHAKYGHLHEECECRGGKTEAETETETEIEPEPENGLGD